MAAALSHDHTVAGYVYSTELIRIRKELQAGIIPKDDEVRLLIGDPVALAEFAKKQGLSAEEMRGFVHRRSNLRQDGYEDRTARIGASQDYLAYGRDGSMKFVKFDETGNQIDYTSKPTLANLRPKKSLVQSFAPDSPYYVLNDYQSYLPPLGNIFTIEKAYDEQKVWTDRLNKLSTDQLLNVSAQVWRSDSMEKLTSDIALRMAYSIDVAWMNDHQHTLQPHEKREVLAATLEAWKENNKEALIKTLGDNKAREVMAEYERTLTHELSPWLNAPSISREGLNKAIEGKSFDSVAEYMDLVFGAAPRQHTASVAGNTVTVASGGINVRQTTSGGQVQNTEATCGDGRTVALSSENFDAILAEARKDFVALDISNDGRVESATYHMPSVKVPTNVCRE